MQYAELFFSRFRLVVRSNMFIFSSTPHRNGQKRSRRWYKRFPSNYYRLDLNTYFNINRSVKNNVSA